MPSENDGSAKQRQARGRPSTVNTATPSAAPRKIRRSVLARRGGRYCFAAARTKAQGARLGAACLGAAALQDGEHGRHVFLPAGGHAWPPATC